MEGKSAWRLSFAGVKADAARLRCRSLDLYFGDLAPYRQRHMLWMLCEHPTVAYKTCTQLLTR